MPIKFKPAAAAVLAICLLAFVSESALAAIVLTDYFPFRDHRDKTATGGGVQNTLQLDISPREGGLPIPDATVTAQQVIGGTAIGPEFNMGFVSCCQGAFDGNLSLIDLVTHPGALDAEWLITATSFDGSDTTSATFPVYGGVGAPGRQALPFLENVQVVGTNSTPEFQWTYPFDPNDVSGINDGHVDRARVRVTLNGDEVFDSQRNGFPIALGDTMFIMPDNFITQNGDYVAQVMLEGFGPYNRSRVFVPFAITAVPIPPAVLMLGSSLVGLVAMRRRRDRQAQ